MPSSRRNAKQLEPQLAAPSSTFTLRPYQKSAADAFDAGRRRQFLVWPRRAGKDTYALWHSARMAFAEPGNYLFLYPTHVQARRAIWQGIGRDGRKFLDVFFPPARRARVRETDMLLELDSGSTWQLSGSDYYDRLVGSNPRGIVFDEWSLSDPRSWGYLKPILRENKGWAIFITTPRARNHAYQMLREVQQSAEWFVDERDVTTCLDEHGERYITDADLEAERAEGMAEDLIRSEYFCDWLAATPGAIYGRGLAAVEKAGRLVAAYDPRLPVQCSWSLERPECFACVFTQTRGNESRVIGSRSWSFASLGECIAETRVSFPWSRGRVTHILPSQADWLITEQFDDAGERDVDLAPEVAEYVTATRALFPLLTVDRAPREFANGRANNELLADALKGYRAQESATAPGTFSSTAAHSWEVYLAHALEIFAAWRAANDDDWHAPPNYAQRDRAVV